MLYRALVLASCFCAAVSISSDCEAFIGNLRIQTLSSTLIRVEPKGPMGFENRPTFMVVDRSFIGVPILSKTNTSNGVAITTAYYSVLVKAEPMSIRVASTDGKVLYDSDSAPASNLLHWPSPLSTAAYAIEDRPRFFVPEWGPEPMPEDAHVDPVLRGTNGYDFRNNVTGDVHVFLLGSNLESWFSSRGEFLRLTGPTPLLPDYAYGTWFTNWEQYNQSRAMHEVGQWEAGRFPLDVWGLDMNWRNTTCGARPVDHWMNCGWQSNSSSTHSNAKHNLSSTCEDHYYNHPNTLLFPNFTAWFGFLERKGLHTYFNDHPFPEDFQTTQKEISFRWQGLTEWISKGRYTSTSGRGLAFWWFDHNWGFTLPPPFTPPFEVVQHSSGEGDSTFAVPWQNLTSQIWGSHIYYETTKRINALSGIAERPIALTRDNGPSGWGTSNTSWPANDSTGCVPGSQQCGSSSAVPAHHRFPIWWTGDGVPLLASVETMVDESVHDFRPFVHSDCGGHHGNASGEAHSNAFMRWTAHCAFGTIHRFHQGEHRPWLYPNKTQDVVRKYLQARYALSPSIIAAGQLVQEQGFPPVARCDLVWPEYPEARSNHQYIHLGDTLVAPLEEQESVRAVWIPPGDWQDAWDGSIVTGPRTINVTKPFSQIPMWHRKGGIMVTTDSKAQRISEQDWSELTLHAYPSESTSVSSRRLVADDKTTVVQLATDAGVVGVRIMPLEAAVSRAWRLRVHLAPTQRVATAFIDGAEMLSGTVQHIEPSRDCTATFPFEGVGAAPACKAGPVAELYIPASAASHDIRLTIV
jgi:hypothetical protein